MDRSSPSAPAWWSWLPSTATAGHPQAGELGGHTRALSGWPQVVRSPAMSSMSRAGRCPPGGAGGNRPSRAPGGRRPSRRAGSPHVLGARCVDQLGDGQAVVDHVVRSSSSATSTTARRRSGLPTVPARKTSRPRTVTSTPRALTRPSSARRLRRRSETYSAGFLHVRAVPAPARGANGQPVSGHAEGTPRKRDVGGLGLQPPTEPRGRRAPTGRIATSSPSRRHVPTARPPAMTVGRIQEPAVSFAASAGRTRGVVRSRCPSRTPVQGGEQAAPAAPRRAAPGAAGRRAPTRAGHRRRSCRSSTAGRPHRMARTRRGSAGPARPGPRRAPGAPRGATESSRRT